MNERIERGKKEKEREKGEGSPVFYWDSSI